MEVAINCKCVVACWKLGNGIASQKKNNGNASSFATRQPQRYSEEPHRMIGNPPIAIRGWSVRQAAR